MSPAMSFLESGVGKTPSSPRAPPISTYVPMAVSGGLDPSRMPPIRGQIGHPQVVQGSAVDNRGGGGSSQPGPSNDAIAEQLKALLLQALVQQRRHQQAGTATGVESNDQQREQTVAALTTLLKMYGPPPTTVGSEGQEAKQVTKSTEDTQEKESTKAGVRAKGHGRSETASDLLKEYRENFRQMEEAYQVLQAERSSLKKRHDELLNEHEKLNLSLQKVLNEIADLKAREQAEADANVMVVQFIVNALRLFLDAALNKQKVEDVLPSLRQELEKLRLPAHDPRLLNCYNRLRQLTGQEPVTSFSSGASESAGVPVSQKPRGNLAEALSDRSGGCAVSVRNGALPEGVSPRVETVRRTLDGDRDNNSCSLPVHGVEGLTLVPNAIVGRSRRQSELPGSTAADKRLEEDPQRHRRAGSDGLLDVPGTVNDPGAPALEDNARRHSATAVGDGSISLAAQFAIAAKAPAPREEHTPVILPEKTLQQKAGENEDAAAGVSTTFLAAQTAAAPDGGGMLQGGPSTSFQRDLQEQLQLLLQHTQVLPYRSRTDSADLLNGKRPESTDALGLDRNALSCSSDWGGGYAATVAAELLRRASSVSMSASDVRRLLEAVVPADRQHPTLHLSSSASVCVPPTPQRTRVGIDSPDKAMQGRWSLDETGNHRAGLIRDVYRSGSSQLEEGVMAPQPSRAGPRGGEDTGVGAHQAEGGVDLMAVYRAVLEIERQQREENAAAERGANGDTGAKRGGLPAGPPCGGAVSAGGFRVGTGTDVVGPQPLTADQLKQIRSVLQQQLASARVVPSAPAQRQDQPSLENLVGAILSSLAVNVSGMPPGVAAGSADQSRAKGSAVGNPTVPGDLSEAAGRLPATPSGATTPAKAPGRAGGGAPTNAGMTGPRVPSTTEFPRSLPSGQDRQLHAQVPVDAGSSVPPYGPSSAAGGPFPLITVPTGSHPYLYSVPPPAPWVFGPGSAPQASSPLGGSFSNPAQAPSPPHAQEQQASGRDPTAAEGARSEENVAGPPVSPGQDPPHTGAAGTLTDEIRLSNVASGKPSWCCGSPANRLSQSSPKQNRFTPE